MIDLDHNATTSLDPRVASRIADLLGRPELHGNPSSVHARGRAARALVEDARRTIAGALGAEALGVTFTSGGTEADNLAVVGTSEGLVRRGLPHGVLTTRLEHPAITAPAQHLAARGVPVVWLDVDEQGRVEPDRLADVLSAHDEVGLVSLAAANHELGNLYDIPRLVEAARAVRPDILFHTDAVQALGKAAVRFDAWGVDLMSITAHKVYGPKGVGALIHAPHQRLEPLLRGGHQERGRRPGTEAPWLVAGFAEAVRIAVDELESRRAAMAELRMRLVDGLRAHGGQVHGDPQSHVGNTVNVRFDGCDGELVLMNLDMEGIAVSTGAACSAGTLEPSPVILALGVPPGAARGAIRMSLGIDNTAADIDATLAALPKILERVRAVGAA